MHDDLMDSINLDSLNIDAMLALTFACNNKMMKFINKIYDTDKDYYAGVAKQNSRFKSRIVTDNRITIRLNAIKALAIITAAKDNEKLKENLHMQIEKVYKTEAQIFDNFKYAKSIPIELMGARHFKNLQKGDTSDIIMNDIISLYFYFSRYYGKDIEIPDENIRLMFSDAFSHETAAMLSIREYFQNLFHESDFEEERKEFADILPHITGFSKSLSEFFYYINTEDPSLLGLFQTWWDIAALDNIPISMYEREVFSRSELEDIFNIILFHMVKERMPLQHMMIAVLGSMILRSFARVYHEAIDTIEQYAGVIETSDHDRKLVEDAKKLHKKVEEQESLIDVKQEKLNAQQLEVDRLRKALKEKEVELAQLQEQNQLLRSFIQNEGEEDQLDSGQELPIYDALEARVIVFGGTSAWQASVRDRCKNYVCVDIKDTAFDTNIINKADAVVFKIDYLPHKQFYRIIDKIRKKRLPVIYCSNNIDLMLKKVSKELLKRDEIK